jgi:hypothetical protein
MKRRSINDAASEASDSRPLSSTAREQWRYDQEMPARSWTFAQAAGASPLFDPIASSWFWRMLRR